VPDVKVLVAGIGNIFFGDDGFGPEVARVLAAEPIPDVKIEDYGIRGLHLAYELVAGYDRAFLIDAVPRGGLPGTLFVIEPSISDSPATPDAHRMDLDNVLAFIRVLGGDAPPVTLVGCQPSECQEHIGLTDPVRRAVRPAADLVRRLVFEEFAATKCGDKRSTVWSEV
jgi:hydrogenase maturation protease